MLRSLQKAMLYVFRECTARLLSPVLHWRLLANRGAHVLVQRKSLPCQALIQDSCEDSLSQCSYAPSEVQGSSSQYVVLGTGAQARVRVGKAVLSLPLMFTVFSSSLLPLLHPPPSSLPSLPLHRLPSLPGPSRNDISPTPRSWRGLCLWKAEAYAWQVTHELCNMAALSSGRVGIPKQFLFCFAFGFLLSKQKIGKQAEMCL